MVTAILDVKEDSDEARQNEEKFHAFVSIQLCPCKES